MDPFVLSPLNPGVNALSKYNELIYLYRKRPNTGNRPEMNNEDFVPFPENITLPDYAATILILGTEDGLCGRGHRLSDYDNATTFDAFNARDVVNGDKKNFPTDSDGNPIGTETYGQRIRRIAIDYKQALLLFPNLDESRRIV